MPEWKQKALFCEDGYGPRFYGIAVGDECNASPRSISWLGLSYINDTELDGKIVFTGSETFQVREVEVFEIAD